MVEYDLATSNISCLGRDLHSKAMKTILRVPAYEPLFIKAVNLQSKEAKYKGPQLLRYSLTTTDSLVHNVGHRNPNLL